MSVLKNELDNILIKRHQLYPRRDPENTRVFNKLINQYYEYLQNKISSSWKPNLELVRKAYDVMESPLIICGFMKSGTTLLTQLLDNHPELNVMPGDSRMFDSVRKDQGFKCVQHLKIPKSSDQEAWKRYWLSRVINPTGQQPFWIFGTEEEPYINFLQYIDYWKNSLPDHPRTPFLSVVLAYFCANPKRPLYPKFWVEKTPNNENYAEEILELFPKARFLHIIRNPITNLPSVVKLSAHRWERAHSTVTFAKQINTSFTSAIKNQELLGEDRYYILQYESLTESPNSVLGQLIERFGLENTTVIFTPTTNGYHAISNSMYSNSRSSRLIYSHTENSDKWLELSEWERYLSLCYIKDSAASLGYNYNMKPNWNTKIHIWFHLVRDRFVNKMKALLKKYLTLHF